MSRVVAIPLEFIEVPSLPSAATVPRQLYAQGGKLWYSDGSVWHDLTATTGTAQPTWGTHIAASALRF